VKSCRQYGDIWCVLLDVTEDNPKLQAAVSLLSTGPVGIGDRIGYTDIELVRRSVLLE